MLVYHLLLLINILMLILHSSNPLPTASHDANKIKLHCALQITRIPNRVWLLNVQLT